MLSQTDRAAINRAMRDCDGWAIRLVYTDSANVTTRRMVSPVRWQSMSLQVLCLCRQEVRLLNEERIESVELVPAHEVLMPCEIEVLEIGDKAR